MARQQSPKKDVNVSGAEAASTMKAAKKAEKHQEKSKVVMTGQTSPKKTFDPYQVIRFPLSTEKAVRQIEFDNKLVFVVDPQATKRDVKRAVEELFKVTVAKVNIDNSFTGKKKAYVRLGGGSLASDVSADLGLI